MEMVRRFGFDKTLFLIALILVAAGVGLYFVFGNSPDICYQPILALGVLAIALGIGFLVSAILSYGIARRLKLIEPTPDA